MARSAYRDPHYRAARADLTARPAVCRCGRPATTIDHRPPLRLHRHVRGADCCQLVPACVACNLGAGARIAAAARARPRASTSRDW